MSAALDKRDIEAWQAKLKAIHLEILKMYDAGCHGFDDHLYEAAAALEGVYSNWLHKAASECENALRDPGRTTRDGEWRDKIPPKGFDPWAVYDGIAGVVAKQLKGPK